MARKKKLNPSLLGNCNNGSEIATRIMHEFEGEPVYIVKQKEIHKLQKWAKKLPEDVRQSIPQLFILPLEFKEVVYGEID